MKIESNLLNISMSQSDRVQEPSKPDSSSSSRKLSLTAAGDGVELGRQGALVAAAQSAGQDERASVVQYLRGLIQSGSGSLPGAPAGRPREAACPSAND